MKKSIGYFKNIMRTTGTVTILLVVCVIIKKMDESWNIEKSSLSSNVETVLNSPADKSAAAKIIVIESEDEYRNLINDAKKRVVVQFAAPWCGACQAVSRPFEEIAAEHEFEDIVCARVDIDKHGPIAQKHEIRGIPTFIFVRDGAVKKQTVGFKNPSEFQNEMRNDIRAILLQ